MDEAHDQDRSTTGAGPSRRSVLAAGAWSIPVISLAAATPAHATSLDWFLSLSPSSISIPVGTTSGEFTVLLTDGGGAPRAGELVTITVPSGFAFASPGEAGGQTSFAFTTDGLGQVLFTVESTGSTAESGVISAVSGPLTATATISSVSFYGWGYNVAAQGQITTTGGSQASPYALDGTAPTSISAIGGTYGGLLWADQNGYLRLRGYNSVGELGVGTTTSQTVPERARVSSSETLDVAIAHIARGTNRQTSIAVGADGSLWAAGAEASAGFATTNTSSSSYTNTRYWQQIGQALSAVMPPDSQIVAAEINVSCNLILLLSSGHVIATGPNNYGSTAQGTTSGNAYGGGLMLTAADTPITDAVSVGIGQYASAIVTADGRLSTSGRTNDGLAGNTSYLTEKALPDGVSASKVVLAEQRMLVLMTDGSVWTLGSNQGGSLGTGVSGSPGGTFTRTALPAEAVVTDIKTGYDGTLFLLDNGDVYFAGYNGEGGGGQGSFSPAYYLTPVQVPLAAPATAIGTHWYDSYYALIG